MASSALLVHQRCLNVDRSRVKVRDDMPLQSQMPLGLAVRIQVTGHRDIDARVSGARR
ncbi:MAG: hypothetical protein JO363_11920 [Solirubrobacterales bacterium]|nr:hypothetical protein [Solirubrobacterales bacterium]